MTAPQPPSLLDRLGLGALARRVAGASAWLLAEQALRILAALATTLILTRQLGPEGFGMVATVQVTCGLVASLITLGLDRTVVVEAARDSAAAGRVLGAAIALQYGAAALALPAVLLLSDLPVGALLPVALTVIVAATAMTPLGSIRYLLIAEGRTRPLAMLGIAHALLRVAGAGYGAATGQGASYFIWLLLLDFVTGPVLMLLALGWRMAPAPRWARPAVKRLAMATGWIAAAQAAEAVNARINLLLVGGMAGAEEAGFYALALRLAEIGLLLPALVIGQAALPSQSSDASTAMRRLSRLLSPLVALGYVGLGLALILGEPLLGLVFGARFSEGSTVLTLLLATAIFAMLSGLQNTYLAGQGRGRAVAGITGAGVAVTVGAGLALVPVLGGVGGALAALAGQVTMAMLVPLLWPSLRPLGWAGLRALALRDLPGLSGPHRL